jgi:hypothetical protein
MGMLGRALQQPAVAAWRLGGTDDVPDGTFGETEEHAVHPGRGVLAERGRSGHPCRLSQ